MSFKKNAQGVVKNPSACGNAWFVKNIKPVSSHDAEMAAISDIDPSRKQPLYIRNFEGELYNYKIAKPADAKIDLVSFDPNHLVYESQ